MRLLLALAVLTSCGGPPPVIEYFTQEMRLTQNTDYPGDSAAEPRIEVTDKGYCGLELRATNPDALVPVHRYAQPRGYSGEGCVLKVGSLADVEFIVVDYGEPSRWAIRWR
jgi:hypothetical protein